MDIKHTVQFAIKLKAKIAAIEARYEKRREKYHALHKGIVSKIKEAIKPLQDDLDIHKQTILAWRDSLPETQEPSLEGVEFRRGKLRFDPTETDLAQFLKVALTGEGMSNDLLECIAWNEKYIQSRIDKMGELHGLPIATIKDRGTIVFKEKKEDATN